MLTQIIILNWNSWPDTVACVKSVLSNKNIQIVVWDNGSTDDSDNSLRKELSDCGVSFEYVMSSAIGKLTDTVMTLVHSESNIGFAPAINRIVEVTLKNPVITDIWLLNNDAIATEKSLDALRARLYESKENAFAGSVILDYNKRDIVQCCGVCYYKFFGVAKLQYKDKVWGSLDKNAVMNNKMNFQNGASLLVKKEIIFDIGLLDESFFLYAEEHDWQHRAQSKGFEQVLAINSIVFHKGSMSTINKKHLFYFYYNNSSVIFSRKHYSIFVSFTATIMLLGITIVRSKFNIKSLFWGIRGILKGWQKKPA